MSVKSAVAMSDLINGVMDNLSPNMKRAMRAIVNNKLEGANTPKDVALAICDALEVAKLVVGDYTPLIEETRRYMERSVTFGENKVYVI